MTLRLIFILDPRGRCGSLERQCLKWMLLSSGGPGERPLRQNPCFLRQPHRTLLKLPPLGPGTRPSTPGERRTWRESGSGSGTLPPCLPLTLILNTMQSSGLAVNAPASPDVATSCLYRYRPSCTKARGLPHPDSNLPGCSCSPLPPGCRRWQLRPGRTGAGNQGAPADSQRGLEAGMAESRSRT